MKEIITMKGIFRSAGDHLLLDYQDSANSLVCENLTEFMKLNIPENSIIEIEITLHKPEGGN